MKKMYKLFVLLLCLTLVLCLCACGKTSETPAQPAQTSSTDAAKPAPASAAGPEAPEIQEAPAEAEPSFVLDTAAYDAAAQAVRDEFIQVTLDGIENFDEEAHMGCVNGCYGLVEGDCDILVGVESTSGFDLLGQVDVFKRIFLVG